MVIFDSTKKIYREDFKKSIRDIPDLSEKEQTYVKGVFQKSLKGGLTKYEVKREIDRLKHKSKDPLTRREVGKLKEKLEEGLK